jgi:hypothetical protein
MLDPEQHPENPNFADPDYAEKWLRGEWIYMNQKEQEEYLLIYGTPESTLKERRKARKQAQEQSNYE